VSGLDSNIAPDEAVLARGVVATDGGFRLAADPRTPLVAGAPFDTLASSAMSGSARAVQTDLMMTLDECGGIAGTRSIPATGHNAHVEAPAVMLELSDRLAAATS
jgi:hypothetical protein